MSHRITIHRMKSNTNLFVVTSISEFFASKHSLIILFMPIYVQILFYIRGLVSNVVAGAYLMF